MNSTFKTVLNPEAAALCEYLSKLPEADLKYVIFMCDYNDSPYWQFPNEVRERKAKAKAYENGEQPVSRTLLEKAMEEYRSLIWDDNMEQRRMLTSKIHQLNKLLTNETSESKIKGLIGSIKLLKAEKDALDREVQMGVDNTIIKGKRKLSFMEIWQQNQRKKKEYENI